MIGVNHHDHRHGHARQPPHQVFIHPLRKHNRQPGVDADSSDMGDGGEVVHQSSQAVIRDGERITTGQE